MEENESAMMPQWPAPIYILYEERQREREDTSMYVYGMFSLVILPTGSCLECSREAPLGPPSWAGPWWAPLGHHGLGPCGLTPGPHGLMGQALVGTA